MNERNVQLDGQPPFGTLRLPSPVESFRSFANMLKGNANSRRPMSLAHGGGSALSSDPIDVDVFENCHAQACSRSYRREKRGFRGVNSWDAEERKHLAADLIAEASLPHVDVLKLDIEGVEFPVVKALFASVPQHLWPRMIILEVGKNNTTTEAYTHCIEHGYTQIRRTHLNAILHRQSDRMPQFDEKNR